MNFNAVNVTMFGVGAILIYCAIKDQSPKDVITNALKQSSAKSAPKPAPASGPTGKHTNVEGSANAVQPPAGSFSSAAGSYFTPSN